MLRSLHPGPEVSPAERPRQISMAAAGKGFWRLGIVLVRHRARVPVAMPQNDQCGGLIADSRSGWQGHVILVL